VGGSPRCLSRVPATLLRWTACVFSPTAWTNETRAQKPSEATSRTAYASCLAEGRVQWRQLTDQLLGTRLPDLVIADLRSASVERALSPQSLRANFPEGPMIVVGRPIGSARCSDPRPATPRSWSQSR
jgi:hypothetical protein